MGAAKDLGPDIVEGFRRIKEKDGPGLIVWGSVISTYRPSGPLRTGSFDDGRRKPTSEIMQGERR
jgi:hypothetical protein